MADEIKYPCTGCLQAKPDEETCYKNNTCPQYRRWRKAQWREIHRLFGVKTSDEEDDDG